MSDFAGLFARLVGETESRRKTTDKNEDPRQQRAQGLLDQQRLNRQRDRALDWAEEQWGPAQRQQLDELRDDAGLPGNPVIEQAREDEYVLERANDREAGDQAWPIQWGARTLSPFVDPVADRENRRDTGRGVQRGLRAVGDWINNDALDSPSLEARNAQGPAPMDDERFQRWYGQIEPDIVVEGQAPSLATRARAAADDVGDWANRTGAGIERGWNEFQARHPNQDLVEAVGEEAFDFLGQPWRDYEEGAQQRDRLRFRGDEEGAADQALANLGDTTMAGLTVAPGVGEASRNVRRANESLRGLRASIGEIGIREAPEAAQRRAWRAAEEERLSEVLEARPAPDAPPEGIRPPRAPIDVEAADPAARQWRAAVRDPETGTVYTGADHLEAIDSAPEEIQGRLFGHYGGQVEDPNVVGFVVDGQFMSRENGLAAMRNGRARGPTLQAQRVDEAEADPITHRADGKPFFGADGRLMSGFDPTAFAGRGGGAARARNYDITETGVRSATVRRTEPGFAENSADAINQAKRTLRTNREISLRDWVAKRGGISDDRGDLRDLNEGRHGWHRIVRTGGGGRQIDDLATAAWEDGYFTEIPSRDEFIEALRANNAGRLATGATDEAVELEVARDTLDQFDQMGADLSLRGRRLRDHLEEIAPEGAQRARTLEETVDIEIPTDPDQWRDLVGRHPWISSPSRAQMVIMANAKRADGSFAYSTNDILERTGLSSGNSLQVQLSKARAEGVPIAQRARGTGGATRVPHERLVRTLDVLESAPGISREDLARRLGTTPQAISVLLSTARKGFDTNRRGAIPAELAERARKLTARAGFDLDDAAGLAATGGYWTAVSTIGSLAAAMGVSDADAETPEEMAAWAQAEGFEQRGDYVIAPADHAEFGGDAPRFGTLENERYDGPLVIRTNRDGESFAWERDARGNTSYLGRVMVDPAVTEAGAPQEEETQQGNSNLAWSGPAGIAAALATRRGGRAFMRGRRRQLGPSRGSAGPSSARTQGMGRGRITPGRAAMVDGLAIGAGAGAGAVTAAATGNDPLAGAGIGGMGGAATVAADRMLTPSRARGVRGSAPPAIGDRSMQPAPAADIEERVARGQQVQGRMRGVRAGPPPPPQPRRVGGKQIEERLQATGRGGVETHLRGLNAGELRSAARILGVEIGKNARASVKQIADAIRNNPDAVNLLREAGLASVIAAALAADSQPANAEAP
ncbi:hypothetical protein [Vitreimonas flagellata]|uniref:hypothetical protein n=1 Tax=Vitreimonas flagellata TaxID=2560861 RepID=UPI001075094F|nr:hypothetical protein [Vitreimonas flagellata]